jgi:hypothetical protein
MRRPVLVAISVAAALFGLAAPFVQVSSAASTSGSSAGGQPRRPTPGVQVREPRRRRSWSWSVRAASRRRGLHDTVAQLPGMTGARVTTTTGTAALVAVTYAAAPNSSQARDVVLAVRGLPARGNRVLVAG